MVSANGLLCLAFYNRLSSLANRSRAMNKERFDLVAQLSALKTKGATGLEPEHLQLAHRHARRTRAPALRPGQVAAHDADVPLDLRLQHALLLALPGPVRYPARAIAAVAPWLFVIGILAMMAGIVAAIEELRRALGPLWYEHAQIDDLP